MFSAKIREKSIEMTRYMHMLPVFLVALVVLILGTAAPNSWADDDENEIPFSKAKIFIEFNVTDEDVGIQVLLDGKPWKRVKVFDPNERKILDITAKRSLRKQALPSCSSKVRSRRSTKSRLTSSWPDFRRGNTSSREGRLMASNWKARRYSHTLFRPDPRSSHPLSLTDEPPVVDPNDFVIQWEPVRETITGSEDIEIVGYQVIVEQEEPLRVFSIDLPASVTSVMVPPEFFNQQDTLHKFEVLAIEASNNQTITSGEFITLP
ncbi:MAG: hypothetical protein U9N47_05600 [Thermodesulfobacteriota bacterium]|nr:hypothetical protein [Thermodesulfobacteriota bacterium]